MSAASGANTNSSYAYCVFDKGLSSLVFFRSEDLLDTGSSGFAVTIDGTDYEGTVFDVDEGSVYSSASDAPWNDVRSEVQTVIFPEGIGIMPASCAFWFYGFENLSYCDLSGLDVSGCGDMSSMFEGCASLESLDLGSFAVQSDCACGLMFAGCTSLGAIFAGSDWNTAENDDMFSGCTSLCGGAGTAWADGKTGSLYARIDSEEAPGYFTLTDGSDADSSASDERSEAAGGSSAVSEDTGSADADETERQSLGSALKSFGKKVSGLFSSLLTAMDDEGVSYAYAVQVGDHVKGGLKTSASDTLYFVRSEHTYNQDTSTDQTITDIYGTEYKGYVYTGVESLSITSSKNAGDIPWYDNRYMINEVTVAHNTKITPLSLACWFYECSYMTSCSLNNFDTSNVTDMSYMFYYCQNVTKIELDKFNTSNVTSMAYMFYFCKGLYNFDVSNFDTSKVTSMEEMFGSSCTTGIDKITIDVSNFNTSKVEYMNGMFESCSKVVSLDVSGFDTSNVYDMSNMFYDCGALTSLDVSNFDTSNVRSMEMMFESCYNLELLDVSIFDTSNVTNMFGMFGDCKKLTSLDVSNFDTSNVTDMMFMFSGCELLTSLDLSSFDVSSCEEFDGMFAACTKLVTIYASSDWVGSSGCTSESMFGDSLSGDDSYGAVCTELVGGNGTGLTSIRSEDSDGYNSLSYAKIDRDGTPGYFTGKYTLTYNANGAEGTAPVDSSSPYTQDADGTDGCAKTTVLGSGDLSSGELNFAGWSTSSDGTGDVYDEGDTIRFFGNTVLYAFWGDPVSYIEVAVNESTHAVTTSTETCRCYSTVESSTDAVEWTTGWYVVSNTTVTVSARITCSGEVHLILCDNCKLTASAGITVGSGSSLTVYEQSESNRGELAVTATGGNAAIGGLSGNTSGTVTINGGEITANSSGGGAGIGGGSSAAGGTFVMNRGDLYTYAYNGGAGIGGGGLSASGGQPGGIITINGGEIEAGEQGDGAAIGGGYTSDGGTISIYDGTVNAYVDSGEGAAIGGGGQGASGKGDSGTILIAGGSVTAEAYSTTNANGGAGIGAGGRSDGESITITGGTVKATGGGNSAGIGGGGIKYGVSPYTHTGGTITITGGTVEATGGTGYTYKSIAGKGGPGIGDGNMGYIGNSYSGVTGTLTIDWSDTSDPTTGEPEIYASSYCLADLNYTSSERPFALSTKKGVALTEAQVLALTESTIVPKLPVYTITLDDQSATTAGTETIYEVYSDGIYLDSDCTTKLSDSDGIAVPSKTDSTFGGYYSGTYGGGDQLIDEDGYITSDFTYKYFDSDNTIYAAWSVSYVDKIIDETEHTVTSSDGEVYSYTPITSSNKPTTWGDSGSDSDTVSWYVVTESATISSRVVCYGDVRLILCDGCTLTASYGITVDSGNKLTIYEQSGGTGALSAVAKTIIGNAAIGGSSGNVCGDITINGGTVTARRYRGGTKWTEMVQNGAAIGCGACSYFASGGSVVIAGGTVKALGYSGSAATTTYGYESGAGIGGGYYSTIDSVTVYEGNVTAAGGRLNAGIGTGYCVSGSDYEKVSVSVYGGKVTAYSGTFGAAIGGSMEKSNAEKTGVIYVLVAGGEVTASSSSTGYGAGIGGAGGYQTGSSRYAYYGNGCNVTVTGGSVTASAGYGAGIGGGGDYYTSSSDHGGEGGTVTITGGTVEATSEKGNGIGGGSNTRGTNTSGGTLTLDWSDTTSPANGLPSIYAKGSKGGFAVTEVTYVNSSRTFALSTDPGTALSTSEILSLNDVTIIPTYLSVTYDANGATSGTVPSDGTKYISGETVTVLGNTGSLEISGYSFGGWNTASDGSGTTYSEDDTFSISSDTTLYALWITDGVIVTLDDGDADTAGSGKVYEIEDDGVYLDSAKTKKMTSSENNVTLPVRSGYTFGGYYTEKYGSGDQLIDENGYITSAFTDSYFEENSTIYAKWTGAFAVLTASGNMVFFESAHEYENGDTTGPFVDIEGAYRYGTVYEGINTLACDDADDVPWKDVRENIKSAIVASGSEINPVSTAYWFYGCSNITYLNMNGFDTSEVTDMQSMFCGCENLETLDLSPLDTGSAANMSAMFKDCSALSDLDVSSFEMDSVTNVYEMFAGCSSLTSLNLTAFEDLSGVTGESSSCDYMFSSCSALETIYAGEDWAMSTYEGTIAENVFYGCSSLKGGNGSTTASGVTAVLAKIDNDAQVGLLTLRCYVRYDSNGATAGSVPSDSNSPYLPGSSVIVLGNTGRLERTGRTFEGWNTKSDGSGTAYEAEDTFTITSSVTLYAQWSSEAYAILSGSGLIFFRSNEEYENGEEYTVKIGDSVVEYTGTVYTGIETWTWDTDDSDTPEALWTDNSEDITFAEVASDTTIKPVDMAGWFKGCSNMTKCDLTGFDTSSVTNMAYLFCGCSSAVSSKFDLGDGFDTSKVTDMRYMFSECSTLTAIDVSDFVTSSVRDMSYMFSGCSALAEADVSGFDTSAVTDMKRMFSGCSSLEEIDVTGFDTAKVTDMQGMFCSCSGLEKLDTGNFDTGKVTDMSYMFYSCSSLEEIDVHGFDTSCAADMSYMFGGCDNEKLTVLDVGDFYTGRVTKMAGMFQGCSSLEELDVSGFITSAAADLSYMFSDCASLEDLDVSGFRTSAATDMSYMFSGCTNVTKLDVRKFDTGSVTDMSHMFANCSSLEALTLTGFDVSGIESGNIGEMFYGCSSLETIYSAEDWAASSSDAIGCSEDVFTGCTSLQGGTHTDDATIEKMNGTAGTYTSGEYAILDGKTSLNSGYGLFTYKSIDPFDTGIEDRLLEAKLMLGWLAFLLMAVLRAVSLRRRGL